MDPRGTAHADKSYSQKLYEDFYYTQVLPLREKTKEFDSFKSLIQRYENRSSEAQNPGFDSSPDFLSDTNEIAIANWLLSLFSRTLKCFEYEPSTPNGKSIDFLVETTDGRKIYFDVKTIHPDYKDKWPEYQTAKEKGRFPKNNLVIFNKDWLGGYLFHKMTAFRGRILEHALGLEEKIAALPSSEKSIFVLMLCGEPASQFLLGLEGFAHFYFSGQYRFDDPLSKMELHYIEEKHIALRRSINFMIHFRLHRYLRPSAEKTAAYKKPISEALGMSEKELIQENEYFHNKYCGWPAETTVFGRGREFPVLELAQGTYGEETIRKTADFIVSKLNPETVYLFGSYATGPMMPNRSSDLDFLVVLSGEPAKVKPLIAEIKRALFMDFRVSADLLVFSNTAFNELADDVSSICHAVRKYGRLMHEAV